MASSARTPSASTSFRRRSNADPTLAERVCLALVAEGVGHGWALGTVLAADGEIGHIWTLSRPLTYRAVDQLVARRLITRRPARGESGRERAELRITARGRKVSAAWLDEPVAHLRDVRTELLVKLALRRRAGLPIEPLVRAQQAAFAPAIAALTSSAKADEDPVDVWRRESARAVRRFLAELASSGATGASGAPREIFDPGSGAARAAELPLSAQNQLAGTIARIAYGGLLATVEVVLGGTQSVQATVPRDALDELDLAAGDDVVVVLRSTEVLLAKAR